MKKIYFKTGNSTAEDVISLNLFMISYLDPKYVYEVSINRLYGHSLYELAEDGQLSSIAHLSNTYLPGWLKSRNLSLNEIKPISELAKGLVSDFFFL